MIVALRAKKTVNDWGMLRRARVVLLPCLLRVNHAPRMRAAQRRPYIALTEDQSTMILTG